MGKGRQAIRGALSNQAHSHCGTLRAHIENISQSYPEGARRLGYLSMNFCQLLTEGCLKGVLITQHFGLSCSKAETLEYALRSRNSGRRELLW